VILAYKPRYQAGLNRSILRLGDCIRPRQLQPHRSHFDYSQYHWHNRDTDALYIVAPMHPPKELIRANLTFAETSQYISPIDVALDVGVG
jgi:hypothetical protein